MKCMCKPLGNSSRPPTEDAQRPVERLVMRRTSMTVEELAEFAALKTQQDKAKFLLRFEITAKPNIKGLDIVYQAFIGDVSLPITGETDEDVISKAVIWLKEKAAA